MKKIISTLLLFIFSFFQASMCLAGDVYSLYKVKDTDSEYLSSKIDLYTINKKHNVYKKNLNEGKFYYQPRYLATYVPDNYLVVHIKQDDKDCYLFIKNNYSSNRMRDLLVENIKGSKLKVKKVNDDILIKTFDKEAITFVRDVKQKDQLFAGTQNIVSEDKDIFKIFTTDNTDYAKFVSIETESAPFQSNLNKKFAGYIFKVKNNYTEPLKVRGIEYHNIYTEKESLKAVQVNSTPMSNVMSVLIGATSIITFGISYAAFPLALAPVVAENTPVINESKEFLNKKPESEIINPKDIISIRVIALKPSAVSKIPYITLKLVNPNTGKSFSVDNEPELLKLYN